MTEKIEKIVDTVNQKHLQPLLDRAFGESVQHEPGECAAVIVDEALRLNPNCCCGHLTGGLGSLAGKIQLAQSRGYCAVGTVIDGKASPKNTGASKNTSSTEEVVLIVGINYGQGSKYLTPIGQNRGSCPNGLYDDTGMRKGAKAVVQSLMNGKCGNNLPNVDTATVVATNYFPWITAGEWGKLTNNIQEALLLHCFGYEDPHAHIVDLVGKLEDLANLTIIFHGAGNAVPILALETRRRLVLAKTRPNNLILCDNLVRVGSKNLKNTVRLGP